MTIILAMKESDTALLIGADGMNSESDNLKAETPTKLFQHGTQNIVWGTAGNRHIGREEFTPWLQSLAIEGDWEWLKIKIADRIAELNGRQRERSAKASIVPVPKDHLIACLLVGWLNGQPQIYEFTDDARVDSYIVDSFRAIGSGMPVAYGAYRAFRIVKGLSEENQFKVVLQVTASSVQGCGKPLGIKRVTVDSVQDISPNIST